MIQYDKNIGYGLDKKQLSNLILVSEYIYIYIYIFIYIYLIQYILLIFLQNLIENYYNI